MKNWIVIYPVDNAIKLFNNWDKQSLSSGERNGFPYSHPIDSDLSSEWLYPVFENGGLTCN